MQRENSRQAFIASALACPLPPFSRLEFLSFYVYDKRLSREQNVTRGSKINIITLRFTSDKFVFTFRKFVGVIDLYFIANEDVVS